MWDIISKVFKGIGVGVDISDTIMDILIRGDMRSMKEKLSKVSGDEKSAAKAADVIDKLRPGFMDLTPDDEVIIKRLLMNFSVDEQATFGGFILWLKKNNIIEQNILKRFIVRCVTSGNEVTGLAVVREIIDMLNSTGSCKDVLSYCEATYLINDSTYEAYKKIGEQIKNWLMVGKDGAKAIVTAGVGSLKEGCKYVDDKCAPSQTIGKASQSFLDFAKKYKRR